MDAYQSNTYRKYLDFHGERKVQERWQKKE